MGRRLAEATKARRTRRTRGETVLCFFLVLVEAAVFFFAGVLFAEVGLDVVLFEAAVFDAVLAAGALAAGDGASPVSTEGWDWAVADDKEPRENREKNPAKHATAKRRTQTLPTAESWHP
jgi:hypothetical protein